MPGLYDFSSNANVSVSNTTGLYIGSGNVNVINSGYGNAQVAAFLPTYQGNISAAHYFWANGQPFAPGGSGTITLTGNVTGSGSGSINTIIANTGVAPGTYGSDIAIPVVTVEKDGRVTSITTVIPSGGGGYGNANVAAYLPTYNGPVLASTLTATSITTTANIKTYGNVIGVGFLYPNGVSILSGVTANYGNANVTALLAGTVTVGNLITANGIFWTNGAPYSTGSSGPNNYGNANVAAYLPTYTGSLGNSSDIIALYADVAGANAAQISANTIQSNQITALQSGQTAANAALGAFETYANATYATQSALSGFETYANLTYSTIANAATLQSEINAINANVTAGNAALSAFETYANATYATQSALSGFETYANLTYSTIANAGILQNEITGANAAIQTLSANIGGYYTYANATYSTIANAAVLQSEITAANAAIVTANTAMKAYVDATEATITAAWTANAATQQGQIYAIQANDATFTTQISALQANTGVLQNEITAANAAIQTLNANVGSFYTYANATYSTIANAASQESEITSLRANITAANSTIQTLSANVGSFYTYANATYSTIANAAVLQGEINTINANIGAFETATNLSLAGANAAIAATNANIGSFYTYANATYSTIANAASQQSQINTLISEVYTNANVAAYLPTYNGYMGGTANNINIYETVSNNPYASITMVDNSLTGGQKPFINTSLPGAFLNTFYATPSTFGNNLGYSAFCNTTGNTIISGGGISGVWISTDAGQTWTETSQTTGNFYTFYNTGSSILATAKVGSNTGIYRSTDGGNSWTLRAANSVISSGETGGYFATLANGHIWAAGENGVWNSSNDGITWTQLVSTPMTTIYQTGNLTLLGAAQNISTTTSYGIWYAVNGGSITQSNVTLGSFNSFTNTGTQLLAVGGGDSQPLGLYKSTNNGVNWIYDSRYSTLISSLTTLSSGIVLAAGSDSGNTDVWRSLDNGNTWNVVPGTALGQFGFENQLIVPINGGTTLLGGCATDGSGNDYIIRLTTQPVGLFWNANTTTLNVAQGNVNANYFTGNGYFLTGITGGGSSYGNAQVAVYLPTDPTIISIQGNVTAANTNIQNISANLGSFETYADSTYATQYALSNFETYANSAYATQSGLNAANASISSVSSGLSSFETYANATYATQSALSSYEGTVSATYATIASLTGFETYANSTYATQTALSAFETYANATFGTSNYGNSNVAAYLPTYSGSLNNSSSIVSLNANVTAANAAIAATNANIGGFYTYANATYATKSGLNAANASISSVSTNLSSFETYANATYATQTGLSGFEGYANATYATQAALTAFETYANATFSTGGGSTYGNANVAAYMPSYLPTYLPNYGGDIGNSTGNANFDVVNATTLNGTIGTASQTNITAIDGYANAGGFTEIQNTSQVYIHAPQIILGDTSYTQLTGINGYLNIVGNEPSGDYAGNAIIAQNGSIAVNPGYYYYGDGSQLANLPVQPGTYSNTNVAAYLAGSVTVGNIKSANGYYWANGTPYSTGGGSSGVSSITTGTGISANASTGAVTITNTGVTAIVAGSGITANAATGVVSISATGGGGGSSFTGNLLGNTLVDTVNGRVLVNASPYSAPGAAAFYTNFNQTPVYSNGVLQPVTAPSGSSTTLAYVTNTTLETVANLAIQSSYQTSTTRAPSSIVNYTQMWPVTANTMTSSDRPQGYRNVTEVMLNNVTWGANSTTTPMITGASAITVVNGTGTLWTVASGLSQVIVAPNGSTPGSGKVANIAFATGHHSVVQSVATFGSTQTANITYARAYDAQVVLANNNFNVVNAVGLHTPSGWASGSTGIQNRFALLNEDTTTNIQTAGNITMTSGNKFVNLTGYTETFFTYSGGGNVSGELTINYNAGTVQFININGAITINGSDLTNMPVGSSITLIINGGGAAYTLTSTSGILWAGGNKLLSTGQDIINIFNSGSNYYASIVNGYQ